ncbi:MAG: DUF6597 domain-containing transcriptional factor [Anaerolineae bacterium]
MFIQIHTPHPPLRAFVKSIIYYRGYTAAKPYEMLLPDGNSQLVIELDGNDRVLKDKQKRVDLALNRGWITGIQTQPVIYQSERKATTLSIQFEPGGLFALFGIPARKFQDAMIDTASIFECSLNELREKLLECQTAEGIIKTTCHFLEGRVLPSESKQALIHFIIGRLCTQNRPLTQISTEAGYSQKQLIQIFKDHVGVSPKRYQRILRFSQSLSILAAQPTADYSQILSACNYYDQAHFINEFRHFSGYRPSQYHAMTLDYPHVISLDTAR